ncbi:tol-pal system protein YbgF [Roseicyclus sp.]|uniref:tol-pal system protein YbgF n=1 Tax=Roseicyclus sp. TaxID=1914329 RepID=UPI003F6B4F72
MRHALILALLIGLCPPMALAQDRTQSLADIRQELSVLFVEMQRLRGELNTTGGAMGAGGGGTVLARIDAIEAELRRLTDQTEQLQIRVERVVTDGTNRIGDLEFRLCELTPDCRIGDLAATPPLGGAGDAGASAGTLPATPVMPSGANLAVAEQSDFDRARAAYEAADYAQAAQLFEAFTQTYPGGPLSAEAHFLRGQSEAQQSAWNRAARAYLDSFTADPSGARASDALLNLGLALGEIGQRDEACLTLSEVGARFPTSPAASEALAVRSRLNCT